MTRFGKNGSLQSVNMSFAEEQELLLIKINGKLTAVPSHFVFRPLVEYLRQGLFMVGTKVVCSEGDCGACTVLFRSSGDKEFKALNSCITPVFKLAGGELLTIEGLRDLDHPVLQAMEDCQGAQCGFCTPGVVMSLAGWQSQRAKKDSTEQNIKNALTGNLCRCTGYEPIIKAGLLAKTLPKLQLGLSPAPRPLAKEQRYCFEQQSLYLPADLGQALKEKSLYPDTQIVAGATDLAVLKNKKHHAWKRLMSLQNLSELAVVEQLPAGIRVGANVSWSELESSLSPKWDEFRNLIAVFASPQIKNMGTVVGNLVNASPIGDSLPFFQIVEAKLTLQSLNGSREVSILDFFQGYKKVDLRPDELVTHISWCELPDGLMWKLYKVSSRRDLDISTVTLALGIQVTAGRVSLARIAVGGVGPTVQRLSKLESEVLNKTYSLETFLSMGERVQDFINPLTDHRGSAEFRRVLIKNLFKKYFFERQSQVEQGQCQA